MPKHVLVTVTRNQLKTILISESFTYTEIQIQIVNMYHPSNTIHTVESLYCQTPLRNTEQDWELWDYFPPYSQ